MDEMVEGMLEQCRQALDGELPHPSPSAWLGAFRQLVAVRAAPGTVAAQAGMLPELVQLASTARFVMGDGGLRVEAEPPGDRLLTLLRRGGLWIRGGEVEAELLLLLSELGS